MPEDACRQSWASIWIVHPLAFAIPSLRETGIESYLSGVITFNVAQNLKMKRWELLVGYRLWLGPSALVHNQTRLASFSAGSGSAEC